MICAESNNSIINGEDPCFPWDSAQLGEKNGVHVEDSATNYLGLPSMSLDTANDVTDSPFSDKVTDMSGPDTESQWDSMLKRFRSRDMKESVRGVLGDSAKGGGVYRWGVAASLGGACQDRLHALSRLACGGSRRKKDRSLDLGAMAEEELEALLGSGSLSPAQCVSAVVWGAALPKLARHLDQQVWWEALGRLQQLRESVLQRASVDQPAHLLIAAELGLTLAWRLRDLPSCKRMEKSSAEAFASWCRYDDEAVGAALVGGADARLVLASLIRCRLMIENTTKRKFKKQQHAVGDALATWVAAMTTHTGGTALSAATRTDVRDDLSPHGLLARSTEFDPEALEPAVAAALGTSQSGGRLAWEVSLPPAYHHSDDAKVAVMLPEWDVRRGRLHVDYSSNDPTLELFAGRSEVIAGQCQTTIEFDDQIQQACSDWEASCEYTDDDVHYLELEQSWTGGLVLQRQFMLIRDDRCVLFADSVLPKGPSSHSLTSVIRYDCRFPLSPSIAIDPEPDTREVYFVDGCRRGLAMPLAAGEWRVGPSDATLKVTDDHHLLLSTTGRGRLFSPLWFDFQQRRFRRKRTWRQLTVADQLRIVDRNEAVGYRVQLGSEQWMVYRSLGESRCRSVLGKHLIADFFAARFDTGDGSMEELVTVDDNEKNDA